MYPLSHSRWSEKCLRKKKFKKLHDPTHIQNTRFFFIGLQAPIRRTHVLLYANSYNNEILFYCAQRGCPYHSRKYKII